MQEDSRPRGTLVVDARAVAFSAIVLLTTTLVTAVRVAQPGSQSEWAQTYR